MGIEEDQILRRRSWRSNWVSSLQQLSDIELQQCWLDKRITNPHWSYVEFQCCYFDDLWLSDDYAEEIQKGYITQEEYDCIKDFHRALKDYKEPNNDPYDHSAILGDPIWQKIVHDGRKATDRLAAIITDPYEKRDLLERPVLYPRDFKPIKTLKS